MLETLANIPRMVSRLAMIAVVHAVVVGGALSDSVLPNDEATSADIVLVPSSDARPYQLAQETLARELSARGHTTQVISPDQLSDDRLKSLEAQNRVFVAIGSSAAVSLSDRLADSSLLVYCMVSDPDRGGLMNRERTGGISTQVPIREQLEIVARALPQTRSVGMLYDSESVASDDLVATVLRELPDGWKLKAIDIRDYQSTAEAFQALFMTKPDIVWTSPDPNVFDAAAIRSLLLSALRNGTPVFGFSTPFVRAGALLGIGIDPRAQAIDAAVLTDMFIRQGVPSERVARHRAPSYDIAVNLIVADELDIDLPRSVVARAKYQFKRSTESPE